ncbi:hypothetical protein [Kitasatospora sp. NPDC057198]|uniref:effector-associated constant component EACC1 n=1 Tax=Kitasatospora sp. NPDC057198 TaxID=3346046 RepID=UPI00362A1B70
MRVDVELHFADPEHEHTVETDMEYLLEELHAVGEVTHRPLGAPPEGTRAGDLTSYTQLIVAVTGGATTLRALIALLQDWLARRNSGTVELKLGENELTITQASRQTQREAVAAFLERTAPAVDPIERTERADG